MQAITADLETLYADAQACAKLIGLSYVRSEDSGYTRRKRGKGFSYTDPTSQAVADKQLVKRITDLVIPPAWQEVWICPDPKGHVLVTGIDEKGRKQYIYHPKWRTVRDLIKFYRTITFGRTLPTVRKFINTQLASPTTTLDREQVIATMLWLLDNTYIRVGNDQYYDQNESIGLTTLTDQNVIVAGSVTTLSFRAKSGKDQQITLDNATIATILSQLKNQRGARLFRWHDDAGMHEITASDINAQLQAVASVHISAKDFRTWGGTLMAFNHLVETHKLPDADTPKPEKVLVQAVDAAANVLGNTRTVARSSYVHPDILHMYGSRDFARTYQAAKSTRTKAGLDKRETELLVFLEHLFEQEFTLLQQTNSR